MYVVTGSCQHSVELDADGARLLRLFWSSDGSGDVRAYLLEVPLGVVIWISQLNVGMSGSTTYTARLLAGDGRDMLAGKGVGLTETTGRVDLVSETAPYQVGGADGRSVSLPVIGPEQYQFTIAGAGASKSGVLTIAVR